MEWVRKDEYPSTSYVDSSARRTLERGNGSAKVIKETQGEHEVDEVIITQHADASSQQS